MSASFNNGCALLFAGQGTDVQKTVQKLVTGAWAEEARDYYNRASAVLGYDLLDVCLNQPDKLKTTAYSQPAIFVTSLATVAKSCAKDLNKADAVAVGPTKESVTDVAGFSLGEYTALVHAGALSFEDGVRLLKIRAEAMQLAADETEGSMVTVVGMSDDKLKAMCSDAMQSCGKTNETIAIANHLFPNGRVLSGHKALVKWVAENALKPKYGAMAANELPVAGAFHSKYMNSARATLQGALAEVDIKMPTMNVYSNVTALKYNSVEEIRKLLVEQLESPVHWEQTIKKILSEGAVTSFVDAGPGTQLQSMMRRIDMKAFKMTTVLDK